MRGLALERRVVVAVTRYLGVALGRGVARCGVLLRRIARLARRIACLAGCAAPATPSPPSPPAAASIGAGSAFASLRTFVELSGGRTVGVVVSGLAAPTVLRLWRSVGASLTLGIAIAVASAAPSSAATLASSTRIASSARVSRTARHCRAVARALCGLPPEWCRTPPSPELLP